MGEIRSVSVGRQFVSAASACDVRLVGRNIGGEVVRPAIASKIPRFSTSGNSTASVLSANLNASRFVRRPKRRITSAQGAYHRCLFWCELNTNNRPVREG